MSYNKTEQNFPIYNNNLDGNNFTGLGGSYNTWRLYT